MGKISVIVPIYKAEAHLPRCIDSILTQTHTNLEIILIDDGSPDNCGKICDEYAKKDSRIKVIHKKNGGVSSARNAGLNIATGDYIAFVDADDYIKNAMYEQLLLVLKETNADISVCNYQYGDYIQEDTLSVTLYNSITACKQLFFSDRFKEGISVAPVDKLYKSELFNNLRFLEACHYAEDTLMCVQVFCQAKTIVKKDITLYHYIRSENSAVLAEYNQKKPTETLAYKTILDIIKNKDDELEKYIQHRYFELVFYHWKQCYYKRSDKVFKAISKQLKSELNLAFKTIKPKKPKEYIKLTIATVFPAFSKLL